MGRSFAAAIAASRFEIDLSLKPGSCPIFAASREKMSPGSSTRPRSRSSVAVRPPRCSMSIAPREAKWTMRPRTCAGHELVRAARHGLALGAHDLGVALGAARGHDEGALLPGAQAGDGRDDLGDDLARAAHDDGVADEHALARDLVGVVQRRHRDRDAADAHGLEHGERRDGARAADATPGCR